MQPSALIAVLVAILAGTTAADDWPQRRSCPNRDAVWTEQGILKSFPADGLKILWRTPVNPGFSSPTSPTAVSSSPTSN